MRTRNFIRHYVEMVIAAMLAGMAVLGLPLRSAGHRFDPSSTCSAWRSR